MWQRHPESELKLLKEKITILKVLKMSFEKEQPKLLGKKTYPKKYFFSGMLHFKSVCIKQTVSQHSSLVQKCSFFSNGNGAKVGQGTDLSKMVRLVLIFLNGAT